MFSLPRIHSQAFAFGKGDDIALAYLKELRQNGTDRRTEMSTLISGGFLEYQAIKEAEEAEVSTTAHYGTKSRAFTAADHLLEYAPQVLLLACLHRPRCGCVTLNR